MSRAAGFQAAVAELPGVHPALARALGEAGEGVPRIRELLEHDLQIRCVGCGIALTAEELQALALDPKTATGSLRLERLRLGYCARNGCDSRFYTVSAVTGMVPWPTVFRRARNLLGGHGTAGEEPGVEVRVKSGGFPEQWHRLQVAVLASVVVLGLVLWWWRGGARIPGITPAARRFLVAPAAETPPAAGLRTPGLTNAPRSFQVR